MSYTEKQVTELYVSTFNRAPDASGLDYWMNNSGLSSIEDMSRSFFNSQEAQTLYSDATSTSTLVESAYQNLFGRSADASGLDYWTSVLDSGNLSQELMIQAMIGGAQGNDAATIQNKTDVALSFVNAELTNGTNGEFTIDNAINIMSNITFDPTTVTTAQSTISDWVNVMNSVDTNIATGATITGIGSISDMTSYMSGTNFVLPEVNFIA